ncbi:hypothetical protein [Georgenia sp. SUBG003]|uniref:hypothetical protein n=1 Tax=Georgenia sp. SUBG003 TaxID=1497974 RepID=UPI003AB37368
MRTTVRRCWTAVATAATVSSTAAAAEVTRTGTAPTARARASWSTAKLELGEVASGASTISGVRLFAASAMPVMAFVRPQPWCTLSAAGPPEVRA